MTFLSIVVPVYRVEAYILKCISSILRNHLFETHCELIIVDDGSPDRSIEIIRPLCAGRHNVTFIHQDNRGLGNARNAGGRVAQGKYLWFVDGDDWIPDNAVANIISLAQAAKPDVINIDHVMSNGDHTPVPNRALSGALYRGIEYLDLSCVQSPAQYYVFRIAFYRASNLHFEQDIYHEDALFTPIALFNAQRVARLAEDCYVYNLREGSIMTSGNDMKHARDMLVIVEKLDRFRSENALTFGQSRILSRYVARAIGGVYYYWKRLDNKARKSISLEANLRLMVETIWRSGSWKYLAVVARMFSAREALYRLWGSRGVDR